MMKFVEIFITKFIFLLTLNNLFFFSNKLHSEALNTTNNIVKTSSFNSEEEIQKDIYILGPGDVLSIEFLGTTIEKDSYQILNDGSISLPLAGDFYFTGKTIKQAKNEIVERLKVEILKPTISITLEKARPISVFVLGEINNPGFYTLSNSSSSSLGLPNLVTAIKSAGGITNETYLKNVELLRLLPGNKKEYKKAELNLLDLIFEGQTKNNPYLFDGDIIKFEKASNDLIQKQGIISSNNLSPDFIMIDVIGEVNNPGNYEVSKNISLFQSILKAGGPRYGRYSKANADLFRLNSNGSATHKRFKIDFKKGISPNNPTLKNGDVVRVRRNLLAKSSDTLGIVTAPVREVVTFWSLFKLID